MKGSRYFAAATLMLCASGNAVAQDGGNVIAALDGAVANLDSILQSALFGDVTSTVDSTTNLVGDLVVDLTEGSPMAPVGGDLAAGTDRLSTTLTAELTPGLDRLAAPVAELASPVVGLYFPSSLLSSGLPLIQGEQIVLLEGRLGLAQSLRDANLPLDQLNRLLQVDVLGPGDGDGGGVLLPIGGQGESVLHGGLGGELNLLANGLPLLNEGGVTLLRDVLETGRVVVGEALDRPSIGQSGGGGMLLGGLLGGGSAVLGGGQGLALRQLPLEAESLDPATASALSNGVTLPGL